VGGGRAGGKWHKMVRWPGITTRGAGGHQTSLRTSAKGAKTLDVVGGGEGARSREAFPVNVARGEKLGKKKTQAWADRCTGGKRRAGGGGNGGGGCGGGGGGRILVGRREKVQGGQLSD